MKVLEAPFLSCAELKELFQPLSPNLAALQLSEGRLLGKLQIFSFGTFRCTLLETNQSLFLSGQRKPQAWTLAIPLNNPLPHDAYRAQGVVMPWPGLMGYNIQLSDFDLRLPAASRLCTLVIAKDELLKRHPQQRGSLTLQRWQNSNQLELRADHANQLRDQIETLIKEEGKTTDPSTAERLLSAVINCFENEEAETRAIKKRQARHTAAIEVLHWCHTNPCQSITVDALSELLYQSRTSLFKGCKEHFNRTPLEVQRAVRLDGVRELLQKPNKRNQLGLKGIKQVAQHYGFQGQSHFTRRYSEAFGEQPQQTIQGHDPADAA